MCHQNSLSSYSKGARGLSVLSRVTGVFTGTSSSPGPLQRQRPSRYAIRAGRNLPDKEFRYLRTVIVTAAVYRGFDSELRPEDLTLPVNLPAPGRRQCLYILFSSSQTPVFLLNSRLSLFIATPVSRSTPSPEVTGQICRVPLRGITRSPWYLLPTYLCRFAVRSSIILP